MVRDGMRGRGKLGAGGRASGAGEWGRGGQCICRGMDAWGARGWMGCGVAGRGWMGGHAAMMQQSTIQLPVARTEGAHPRRRRMPSTRALD